MWRRLLGKFAPYPRVQIFKEKIKIKKLHENIQDTCKYGAFIPPGCKRSATFAVNYKNGIESDQFCFDIYITDNSELQMFISKHDMKRVVDLHNIGG